MEVTLASLENELSQAYQACIILEEFLNSPEAFKAENFSEVVRIRDNLKRTEDIINMVEDIREEFEARVFELEHLLVK